MSVGKMRERVHIQQRTETADTYGGQTTAWSDLAIVWAQVKPRSGLERYYAQKIEHNVTHVVHIRYRSDITSKMRLQYNNRNLKILSIIDVDERNRYMTLTCEEGSGS